MNNQPLIVFSTNDGKQKKILLTKPLPYTLRYDVCVDEENEAIAQRDANGWRVHPSDESRLTEEDCDSILRALENSDNSNIQE